MADNSDPRRLRIPGPLAGFGWEGSPPEDPKYPSVLVGDATGLRLAANPSGPFQLQCNDGSLGRLTLPRGIAVDQDLRVYLLDAGLGVVFCHDPSAPGYDPAHPFVALPAVGNHPASGPATDNPRRLAGATAIAADKDSLFVGDTASRRVLVFALNSWALRDGWRFPVGDQPLDVIASEGRVFVLTPDRIYAWHPGDTAPRQRIDRPKDLVLSWSRLAAGRCGCLYVLAKPKESPDPILLVYEPEKLVRVGDSVKEAATVRDCFRLPPVYALPDESGQPQFVLPEPLARACGRTWPTSPVGRPVEAYFTRRPGPKDGGFVFDVRGNRLAPADIRPPRRRLFRTGVVFLDSKKEIWGSPWLSRPLDSRLFDCRWDVVELAFADLPPGCLAEVSTFTANDDQTEVAKLPDEAWEAGLSVTGPPRSPEAEPRVRTDFLVGSPPGRFLWLRIRFRGDGFATPVLERVEIRFPRRSYLEHLPAVFSEDEAGRRFLERFLSVFQAEWDVLESRAGGIAGLFDPRAVPDTHLDYLAGWFGTRFENGWPADAKRRLLERLPQVFFAPPGENQPGGTRRGTPAALRDYVAAVLAAAGAAAIGATGFPLVIEGFRDRDYRLLPAQSADRPAAVLAAADPGEAAGPARPLWGPEQVGRFQLGVASRLDEERLLPPGPVDLDVFATHAHRFRVVVPAAWARTADVVSALRRAIEAETPAHTSYELELVRPGLRVGVQSTVGVDTILGGPAPLLNVAGSGLGASALPGCAGPGAARLDGGVRLGADEARI